MTKAWTTTYASKILPNSVIYPFIVDYGAFSSNPLAPSMEFAQGKLVSTLISLLFNLILTQENSLELQKSLKSELDIFIK